MASSLYLLFHLVVFGHFGVSCMYLGNLHYALTIVIFWHLCTTLKVLFENDDATTIIDFIKGVNFYHLV